MWPPAIGAQGTEMLEGIHNDTKIPLEQKGRYEKLVIAQRLSDMLDMTVSKRRSGRWCRRTTASLRKKDSANSEATWLLLL